MSDKAFAWLLMSIGVCLLLWILGVELSDYRQLHRRITDCHHHSGEIFINEDGEYLCLDPRKIEQ
jgi:hypothetical protein